jgi:hypothetical protein
MFLDGFTGLGDKRTAVGAVNLVARPYRGMNPKTVAALRALNTRPHINGTTAASKSAPS